MPFTDLPPEVVEILAEYLAYEHPPTLLSLARANKSLHAWCASVIKLIFFHDIKLSIGLEADVAKLVESLQRKIEAANSFRQVRRLIITTTRDNFILGEEWKPPTVFSLRRTGLIDRYSTQYSYLMENTTAYWMQNSALDIPDHAWKPVADLIRRLPALTDVIYRYSDDLPLSLLEALRPTCRLHMHLYLASDMEVSGLVSRALITSPSLYCVSVHYDPSSSSDGNLERFASSLRALSLAPKLKQVTVLRTHFSAPLQAQDLTSKVSSKIPQRRISPEAFSLGDYSQSLLIEHTTLIMLCQCVDFSNLKSLELKPGLDEATLEALKEYTTSGQGLSRLRSLKLDIYPYGSSRHTTRFYDSVTDFFGKLPPLSELELQGWHSRISIGSIAGRHGSRLRRLHFKGSPLRWQHGNKEEILQLGKYCPLLEELTIPVQRSKGDKKEVALFRALGTIPSLRYLDLSLEVSPAALYREDECLAVPIQYSPGTRESPTDPSFDDFDNQWIDLYSQGFYRVRKGYIRDVMINSRVDQELACTIFRAVSSSKSQGAQPLEAIQISVTGDGGARSGLVDLVDLFSSTWIVRQDSREDHRGELIVEVPPLYVDQHLLKRRETYLGSKLDEIFRRIWPRKEEQKQKRSFTKKLADWRKKKNMRDKEEEEIGSSWWNDCRSFPLDMSS